MRTTTLAVLGLLATTASSQPLPKAAAVIAPVKPTLAPAVAAADAPTLDWVDAPENVILNTRDFPFRLAYTNVPAGEPMDIHIDLIGDGGYTWFGGGVATVTEPTGEVTIPIEVRVPSYYGGKLAVHGFITPAGGNFEGRVGNAPELEVGIDHTPVNAIGVLCQPRVVTPGKRFVINLWFTQTHAREMDLIVVALNGDTKEYFGGFQVGVKEQQGHVSGDFDFHPAPLDAPIKFKAWLSPKGEVAPNYVTYTMLNLEMGPELVQPCNPNPNNEWTQTGMPEANWVELHDVPKEVAPGDKVKLTLKYNLLPTKKKVAANATVAMMTWDWRTHEAKEIVSVKTTLTPVFDEAKVALTIPEAATNGPDGIYFIVFLPEYAGVEDRVYQVKFDALGMRPAGESRAETAEAVVEVAGPVGAAVDAHVLPAAGHKLRKQ